jgi:hypothetical protein
MSTALAYSKTGAADAAGVSTQTLDRAIKSGALRAKRSNVTDDGEPAGKVIILATDLADWLDGLADA